MSIELRYDGEPKAVQSVRFARMGKFVRTYQPSSQVEWKNYVRLQTSSQLAEKYPDFQMFSSAVHVKIIFTFPPLKSFSKKQHLILDSGVLMFKPSRPDLADNLCKGIMDALTGIVWTDDSLICSMQSIKIFNRTAFTAIAVSNYMDDLPDDYDKMF